MMQGYVAGASNRPHGNDVSGVPLLCSRLLLFHVLLKKSRIIPNEAYGIDIEVCRLKPGSQTGLSRYILRTIMPSGEYSPIITCPSLADHLQ